MTLAVAILAGGKGTRMCSKTPKVLHHLGGKPLLEHVFEKAKNFTQLPLLVVYGHQGEAVQTALAHWPCQWVEQKQPQGTGHALQQVLPYLNQIEQLLVLSGDVPLLSLMDLEAFIKQTHPDHIGLLTGNVTDPTGLGRILRDAEQKIVGIIEERDATLAQRQLTEINTGIYLFPSAFLQENLCQLNTNNAQQEYYLTDLIALARRQGLTIQGFSASYPQEALGINDRYQLAQAERYYQQQKVKQFAEQGVTFLDPARVDFRGKIEIAPDVTVDVNVIFEGQVTIETGASIGPNCYIRNVTIGKNVKILANTVIEDAIIEANAHIGPFARVRPGSHVGVNAKVGNFVEIKNTIVGNNSKINHLSYVGDAILGEYVNVGAGTITCNYDGVNKYKTYIGDEAFIGSNTALVAPIKIGKQATIGAGSVLTKDAPENSLTLSRSEQKTRHKWSRSKKREGE